MPSPSISTVLAQTRDLRCREHRYVALLVWLCFGCGSHAGEPVPSAASGPSEQGIGAASMDSAQRGPAGGSRAANAAQQMTAGRTAASSSGEVAAAMSGAAGTTAATRADMAAGTAGQGSAEQASTSAALTAGMGAVAGSGSGTAGSGASNHSASEGSLGSGGSSGSSNQQGAQGAADAPDTAATDDAPLTVFIASDSTASNYKDTPSDADQAGWGQMLPEYVEPRAKVDNRALGGRTARRFIDEGHLDEIWDAVEPGDCLLVQFGTNDGNRNATYTLNGRQIPYYLDPATDFKTYIRQYIDGARSRGVTPILVTPPPRNSAYCTGGNGTGAHAQALRELGESEAVFVVDLNQMSVQYLQAICPEPNPPDFFLQRTDGSVDGTHFQERGARKLASFVAAGLRELGVTWAK